MINILIIVYIAITRLMLIVTYVTTFYDCMLHRLKFNAIIHVFVTGSEYLKTVNLQQTFSNKETTQRFQAVDKQQYIVSVTDYRPICIINLTFHKNNEFLHSPPLPLQEQ